MNHAITVGGLMAAIGIFVGVIAMLLGALGFMAEAMSDAPTEGNGATGCAAILGGMLLIVGCVAAMVL
jgi:hypothetical protein